MADGLDLSKLDTFTDSLIRSSKDAGKAQKKFLREQGNKLKRKTKAQARVVGIQTQTGNYMKGISRGKVWSDEKNANCVRVYSNAPHAHLIEDGHKQTVNPGKGKGNGRGVRPGRGIGRKVGTVDGREVFIKAEQAFEPEFERASEDMIDEVIRKI